MPQSPAEVTPSAVPLLCEAEVLRRDFGRGLILRGDAVVGVWHVDAMGQDGDRPSVASVSAVRRTPDGGMAAVRFGSAPGADHAAEVAAALDRAEGPDAHRPVASCLNALWRLARWDGGDHPGIEVAQRMHHLWVVLDGRDRHGLRRDPGRRAVALADLAEMRDLVREWVATVDARALAVVGHFAHQDDGHVLGACYRHLDRTSDPAAPLATALLSHPLLGRSVLAAWRDDPVRTRRDVGDGTTAAPLTRVWAARGLPGALAPLVLDLERDLVAEPYAPTDHHLPMSCHDDDACVRLVDRLSGLPRNWMPRDAASRRAMMDWDGLVDQAWAMARGTPDLRAAMAVLVDAGRGWPALASAYAGLCGDRHPVEVVWEFGDAAQAYVEQVVLPAAATSSAGSRLSRLDASRDASLGWRLLCAGRSLLSVLRLSARWHGAAPRMAVAVAALGSSRGAPDWPALLPDHVDGDLELRVLTSVPELLAEGARGGDADGADGLAHCVGGYGPACRQGRARVASIRRRGPDGRVERLSTVGFACGNGEVSVEQHRGRANAEPPAACVALLAAYLDGLDGAGHHWPSVADPFDVAEVAGYDPTAPGALDAVRALWRPFEHDLVRDLDAAHLARLAENLDATPGSATWMTRDALAAEVAAAATSAPEADLA